MINRKQLLKLILFIFGISFTLAGVLLFIDGSILGGWTIPAAITLGIFGIILIATSILKVSWWESLTRKQRQIAWSLIIGLPIIVGVSIFLIFYFVIGIGDISRETQENRNPEISKIQVPADIHTSNQYDISGIASDPDNDPLTFNWDFGDGSTGSGENLSHSYAEAGQYTITLTVTDGKGGEATLNKPVIVTIPPSDTIPETASSDSTLSEGKAGIGVLLTLDEEGNIVVEKVLQGMSAAEDGILPGDKFIEVDKENIEGKDLNYVVGLIRGEEGTKVSITTTTGEYNLTRQTLPPEEDFIEEEPVSEEEEEKEAGEEEEEPAEGSVEWKISYAHTQPGVQSEIYLKITGPVDADVIVTLSGPGIVSPAYRTATLGADGSLLITWVINKYGTYSFSGTVDDTNISGSIIVN